MFRRIFALFRPPRGQPALGPARQGEIEKLERQLQTASADAQPQLFNRIGDLYAKSGNRERAVSFYGRAIDGYLEAGYFDAAAAMCRKLIELSPDVIRARCTLAFLSLGKGLVRDAQQQITDYVRTSQRMGQEEFAVERLRLMTEATDEHELRLLLGEYLAELGDEAGANEVFGAVYAERNQLSPAPPQEDQRERWARLLRVAVTGTTERRDKPMNLAAD